jgi:hypothetical protein
VGLAFRDEGHVVDRAPVQQAPGQLTAPAQQQAAHVADGEAIVAGGEGHGSRGPALDARRQPLPLQRRSSPGPGLARGGCYTRDRQQGAGQSGEVETIDERHADRGRASRVPASPAPRFAASPRA